MDAFRRQALELWNRWQALSLAQKMVWLGGVAGSIALASLLWWAAQPEYRVLYAGLSAEEAGPITTKLQAKGIPFKLAAGGANILVPADQLMQAHIDLTSEGVAGAKMGKGLDLFDQPMLGATPFSQDVTLLRAQQVELAKTIMQIDPIVFARVHIVRPERTVFKNDRKPATASVVVKLRPGATLHRKAVTAITSLVAGSVEGLPKENVSVVDTQGRLLSVERDPETGAVGSFIEIHNEVEAHFAKKAEQMLEEVLGVRKAIVRVTVDIDTKLMRKKEEKINVEGRVPKSEKSILTKSTSGSSSKGGAAGSSSNLGKAGPTSSSGPGSSNTSESQTFEFDYPRTVIEWQQKHGTIERLTIAAFVDSDALKSREPPISLDQVKEAIKKAVGFKADRDEISVTAVKMPTIDPESLDDDSTSHGRLQTILTIVRYGSIAAIALCVVPMIWMLFRRRRATLEAAAVAADAQPAQRLTDELNRNPEALAKILSFWIGKSESEQKAA